MFVCLCKGVTERAIRAEVSHRLAAQGSCSVEEIAGCTGAGTKCGSCRQELSAIVHDEVAGAAVRRSLPVLAGDAAAA